MQSPEFAENLVALTELARSDRVVLMCAEAVPWRCHRSLIADALIVHGVPTCEIISPKSPAVPQAELVRAGVGSGDHLPARSRRLIA